MAHEIYIARRVICDYVHSVGGLVNIRIDQAMMLSVAGARQRYMMYLDEKKRQETEMAKGTKRKSLLDEIEQLKHCKKRLQTDSTALEIEADSLAIKAESSGKLTLIAKSNSLRRTAKEKQAQIKELEGTLETKLQELKNS